MANFNLLSEKYFNTIENYYLTNRIPSVVIITSNSNEVNFQAALSFACRIICDQKQVCFKCYNCNRIISNSYPDFMILNSLTMNLKKADVTNIITTFNLSALENADKKIYLIQNIEDASLEANNSLLKFLEEPPKNTFAIITSKNFNKVLKTIISRSQIIKVTPPSICQWQQIITKNWQIKDNEDIKLLSHCFNDWQEIIDHFDYEQFLETKNLAITFLTNCFNDNFEDNYLLSQMLMKYEKKQLQLFLNLIMLVTKDSFLQEPQYFVNQNAIIIKFKNWINNNQNFLLTIIYECLERLKLPINKNLLVDYFIIKTSAIKIN